MIKRLIVSQSHVSTGEEGRTNGPSLSGPIELSVCVSWVGWGAGNSKPIRSWFPVALLYAKEKDTRPQIYL